MINVVRGTPVAVLCAALACAPASVPAAGEATGPTPRPPAPIQVPAGHGTLRQDEFTVPLRDGALQIKVTPLAESVIRLAAPDTYDRLHALAESRRSEAIAEAGTGAALFLVSFFSDQPDAPYQPEDLRVVHQGRTLRPRAILALTPRWGAQRLRQQETQSALYVFEPGIDPDLPMMIRYGMATGDAWSRILPVLRVERAKVLARAGSEAPGAGQKFRKDAVRQSMADDRTGIPGGDYTGISNSLSLR